MMALFDSMLGDNKVSKEEIIDEASQPHKPEATAPIVTPPIRPVATPARALLKGEDQANGSSEVPTAPPAEQATAPVLSKYAKEPTRQDLSRDYVRCIKSLPELSTCS